jgi:hypothetical protein
MSELPADALSPTVKAALALIQGLLPALAAVVGGVWVAFTFLAQQEKSRQDQAAQAERENRTRVFEARKPFIDRHLKLYVDTSEVIGKFVATDEVEFAAWMLLARRFEQLFWSELSMVEDDGVKRAMQDLRKVLIPINSHLRSQHASRQGDETRSTIKIPGEEFSKLQQAVYRLARALRSGVEATWNVNLSNPAPPAR